MGIKLRLLEGGAYLHILFEILVHGRFVSSPQLFIYSIIYLYRYELMGIYFILWIITQYYVVYFVAQIVPGLGIECPFGLVLVSLWHVPILFFSFF